MYIHEDGLPVDDCLGVPWPVNTSIYTRLDIHCNYEYMYIHERGLPADDWLLVPWPVNISIYIYIYIYIYIQLQIYCTYL